MRQIIEKNSAKYNEFLPNFYKRYPEYNKKDVAVRQDLRMEETGRIWLEIYRRNFNGDMWKRPAWQNKKMLVLSSENMILELDVPKLNEYLFKNRSSFMKNSLNTSEGLLLGLSDIEKLEFCRVKHRINEQENNSQLSMF